MIDKKYIPKVTSYEVKSQDNVRNHSVLFSKSIYYENRSVQEIFVVDKNYVSSRIPATPEAIGNMVQEFSIIEVYAFQTVAHVKECLNLLIRASNIQGIPNKAQGELIKALSLIVNQYERNTPYTLQVSLKFSVNIPSKDMNGAFKDFNVYIPEAGVVVCSESCHTVTIHPDSQKYRDHQDKQLDRCFFPTGMAFEIVDNYTNIGERYFFSGKEVLRINPIEDPSRACGLYVYQYNVTLNGEGVCDIRRHLLENPEEYGIKDKNHVTEFDKGCVKHGLFKTAAEAKTSGNPEIIESKELEAEKTRRKEAERQLENLKHEGALATLELSRTINESKAEALEAARQLENLKHKGAVEALELTKAVNESKAEVLEVQRQNEILKSKLAEEKLKRDNEYDEKKKQRDDYYDDRSSKRKDTSEIIKWVPTIIGAAIAVAAILFKLFW